MTEPEIRYLGDVQRLVLGPNDTLVLTVGDRALSMAQREAIREALERVFGTKQKVLILDGYMKVGVLGDA